MNPFCQHGLDEIFKDFFDLKSGSHSSYFEYEKVDIYDHHAPHPDNSFNEELQIFKYSSYNIKEDAKLFFTLSARSKDDIIRFITLWSAMECQIGKGPKAKQFFQKCGCSDNQLDHFSSLAKVRGQIAHNGLRSIAPEDYWDLFKMFRLSCLSRVKDIDVIDAW